MNFKNFFIYLFQIFDSISFFGQNCQISMTWLNLNPIKKCPVCKV